MNKKIISIILVFIMVLIWTIPVFALNPSDNDLYKGIDVSEWQGNIDFRKVKKAGIEIVYIRAGQGFSYKDSKFERNYEEAKKNGLKIGVYHYMTARTTKEAKDQAKFFISLICEKEIDCKLAMDFESFGNLSNREINEIALAYIKEVERLSKKEVIVYSNTYNAKYVFSKELAKYPLWVAQYGLSEPQDNGKWSSWEGFQYSSSGRVDGINGNVDLDRYTKDILLDSNEPINHVDNPKVEKEDRILYKIKRGDTLSEIALKFDTTVTHLASLNNIRNPNLIYSGDVIIVSHNHNKTKRYKIKRGDTLSEIAQKFNTTISYLAKINKIKNPDLIYAGEYLKV